jgi:hypothetical protein
MWVDNIKMDLRQMGWIGLNWLRIGTSGGPYEHGNEPSVSINAGEFLSSCRIGFSSRRAQLVSK